MKRHMTRTLITLLTVAATASACGTSDIHSDDPASGSGGASEPTAVAQPRLVVASDAGVEVVGGAELQTLDRFELASRPKLQAIDDRHVFVLQSDAGKVGVVDAGTWSVAHGSHSHSYVAAPALLETRFDHGTSYHAVSDEERSVVWFDTDGSFEAFDTMQLQDDEVDVKRVETGHAHHGVAVPTSNGGFLASYPDGEQAAGVLVLDADGHQVERIGGCEGLHGEAHVGDNAYAFGCSDGVLVVEDGRGVTINSPVVGAGTSSVIGSHDSDLLVGNLYSDDNPGVSQKLAFYDVTKQTAMSVDLGVRFSSMVRDDGQTVVLGTDGALHVIDEASGAVIEQWPVVKPWTKTEDYREPKPQVVIGGGFAWVTDPRDNSLALFELGTGEQRSRTILQDTPTSLLVVNAPHLH